MNHHIGYCGYDCSKCSATSDDPQVRQKLVDAWRKVLGHTMYTADNVHCCGCKSDGHHADSECQARPCALVKGLDSCAECDEFPCRKVAHLVCSRDSLTMFCHQHLSDISPEEFEIATAQFTCSQENMLKILRSREKLPNWLK
ncbi:MAG TPA: DUF3795 domain-containing protein [Candidatus Cloacimonadota bacterium]|nr:DUF3795 domain-containing protein [Candidatus Cloacimonadota bacterium]